MNSQLTDDKKLLVINLVINLFIKPSNTYYRKNIIKLQRFWRKRSGYYCFTPLTKKKMKMLNDKYYMNSREMHNYSHPPILKRSMNSCGGLCLSNQQRKMYNILHYSHKKFCKDIMINFNKDPLNFSIPIPTDCVCGNYENDSTLENLWRIRDDRHMILERSANYRKKWKRLYRNSIYLTLAKDEISWFTRNTMIKFLKTKGVIK
jgi:hypothetical protein